MSDAPSILFVRGFMRSGTNWTGALLNLHPDIHVEGEYHFRHLAAGVVNFKRRRNFGSDILERRADEWLERFVRETIIETTRDRPWRGDRTPAPIDHLLPNAPTICIVRDGRDVLTSFLFHRLRLDLPMADEAQAKWKAEFLRDPASFDAAKLCAFPQLIETQCRRWAEHVGADLDTIENPPAHAGPVHLVRYEEVHARTEAELERMFQFLGVDPGAARAPSEETRTSPGFEREDPLSLYRAGRVGDWERYLTDEALEIFEEIAGDVARRVRDA